MTDRGHELFVRKVLYYHTVLKGSFQGCNGTHDCEECKGIYVALIGFKRYKYDVRKVSPSAAWWPV